MKVKRFPNNLKPNDNILDLPKVKAFTDDILTLSQTTNFKLLKTLLMAISNVMNIVISSPNG